MDLLVNTPALIYEDAPLAFPSPEEPETPLPIFSKEMSNMFRLINCVLLGCLISLFGIGANAINIIVFYKQGFNTTTKISFFALAISDMGCLVSIVMSNEFVNPYLDTDDAVFIFAEIQYLISAWFDTSFNRITSWITVFITAERCLGVAWPLKVKQIITSKRTAAAMCVIFTIHFFMILPEYSTAYLDWKFDPAKNRTVFGLLYRSNTENIYGLVYSLTSISGIISFIFVTILTAFLVINLERKSKWRQQATGGTDNSQTVSTRDKKMMKMIVMIATVLIVCYTPGTILSVTTSFVPDFMINRTYENLFYSFWSISSIFTATNSSINVFVYYRMSTKYRQIFNELFSKTENSKFTSFDSKKSHLKCLDRTQYPSRKVSA